MGTGYFVAGLTGPPASKKKVAALVDQEIVDDLEAALEQFRLIADDLRRGLRERKYERIFSRESLGDEHPILP